YRRDPTGLVTEIVSAPGASWAHPGWRFDHPVSFDVQSARRTDLGGPRVYATAVDPSQIIIRRADADSESIDHLTRSIAAVRAAGHRTSELDGKWW
ncbi:hypothetical protein ACE4Z5_24945, partial [Salmonella enterica]|uniref:hypothetical protein n=1 Tax=Salmonella enterica TaxID=28901 RepID=UPI003D29DC0C